ncbi:hypothetical protein CHUAL_008555 [Chamberlinius hualienensis]
MMGLEIHHVTLGLFLFFTLAIRQGVLGIFCWECNSEYDHRCKDPFRNFTFAPTDCSQRFLLHYPEHDATVCRKIVQRVKGEYRYIRSCGFLEDEKAARGCYRRAGTFDVQIEYCQCKHDECNAGYSMLLNNQSAHSKTVIIAASVAILMASYLYNTNKWMLLTT